MKVRASFHQQNGVGDSTMGDADYVAEDITDFVDPVVDGEKDVPIRLDGGGVQAHFQSDGNIRLPCQDSRFKFDPAIWETLPKPLGLFEVGEPDAGPFQTKFRMTPGDFPQISQRDARADVIPLLGKGLAGAEQFVGTLPPPTWASVGILAFAVVVWAALHALPS
jgi:hypothetical protein